MENLDYYVQLAVNGDRQAFEELYRQTYYVVYYTCINLLKNEQDALDVTQDVYVTVMNNICTLDDTSKFLCWLNRIAVNKCKDFLKKSRPILMDMESMENPPLEENENFLPEEYITNKAKRQIVMDIIRTTLSETEYQTVLLYYYNGLSVQEIAEVMECPQGTVMYRLSAARGKVRKGVLAYENKNDDKLYGFGIVPFFVSLFVADVGDWSGMRLPPQGMYALAEGVNQQTTGMVSSQIGETVVMRAGKAGIGVMKTKIIAGIVAVALVGGGIAVITINSNKDEDKGEKITSEQSFEEEDSEDIISTENNEIDNKTEEENTEEITEEIIEEPKTEEGFSGVDDSDIEGNKATIEVNYEETEVDIVYGEYDFREGKFIYNGIETTYKECLDMVLADNWEPLYESEIVSIDEISVEAGEQKAIYFIQKFTDENGELQDASTIVMMFYNSSDEELPVAECEIYSMDISFNYGYNATATSLPGGINDSSSETDIYNAFGTPTSIIEDEINKKIKYVWDKDDVTLTIKWSTELNEFEGFRYEHPTVDYSQYF